MDSVEAAVEYIRTVIDDYIAFGASGDRSKVQNKKILEIGPGDNLGVALMFIALGAESVTCIDGFAPGFSNELNAAIYAALRESLTTEQRRRTEDWERRVTVIYNHPVECGIPGSYDIIVSRAVLEHLADLPRGWRNMAAALNSGGEMWHKVDMKCHKIMGSIHPLYFLTAARTRVEIDFLTRPDTESGAAITIPYAV